MQYKKVAIIGIAGSGKSTLSRFLSKSMRLPVFHVDTMLWKGNWQATPKAAYLLEHQAAVENDSWIIEGYVNTEMSNRLSRADLVLYLDYSGIRCFFRAFYRLWKHHKISRPELPSEAVDYFDPKVFLRVLIRAQRREIAEVIKISKPARVIRFYSPSELDRFIMNEFDSMAASHWISGRFVHANEMQQALIRENCDVEPKVY